MRTHRTHFSLISPQLLATVTLVTSASAVQVGYQYYRFTPTKLRTDATTGGVQISEFDFLLSGAPISRTGVVVTNPGGTSNATEGPEKLIDGLTTTKWLDFNKSQVVFNFGTAANIDGYRFTTANDANDRDPVRWIFEGSADGSTWTLLDHQTSDFATPTARQTATTNLLLPVSPAPYLFTWSGSVSNDWNTTTGNWDAGLWDNGQLLHARFTNASPATISLTEPITARKVEATGDTCTLQGSSLSFSSIRSTGAGATTISNTAPLTIASAITGTGGWTKTGSGNLTLTGANTYVAPTNIIEGSVTYAPGSSYNPASNSNLRVGGSIGRGVLNLDTTGILKFGGTRLGGDDNAAHTGKGALFQTAGEVTLSTSYLELGVGVGASGALTDTYGAYSITGGKLTNTGGTRTGCGGYGSFHQAGGEYNAGNWFAIGASTGALSFGTGVATFTGGTANPAGNARILMCDRENNTGTLNIGTLAGGNAVVTTNNTGGPSSSSVVLLANTKGLSATVNLNGGTLRFSGGGIARNGTEAGKTAVVNLNGGTLQANSATSRDLIVANSSMSVNVYNGGLTVDTQGNPASISANLLATTGNGIYPAGGVISVPANGGSGYLGAPLVSVTTSGSGTGATAIANVSGGVVTGVTLTCPGQGYVAGDIVTFTFVSGGATTAATAYAHTLTAANLAANGAGGLTKLGTGTLTLTGNNTFTGPVNVTGKLVTPTNPLTLNNTSLTLNGFTPSPSTAPIEAMGGLITGGTVQLVVNGSLASGQWPLIYYPFGGSIGGSGIGAFQVQSGSLPRGVTASIVDNTANSSVDLLIAASPLTWKGNTNAVWDINTTTNWTIGATPEKYLNGDLVLFNDSATGSTNVTLNATVVPQSVTFNNDTKNYTLSGSGGIGGNVPITKSNFGTLTLLNDNTTTGATTVEAGTLKLGNGTVNGSIAGPLVNNDTVIFDPAGSSTHVGSLDGFGTFTKNGPGTQIITSPSNTASGTFVVNEGTLQFGNGTTNGVAGSVVYDLATGTTLRFDQATATALPADIGGAGNIVLNSAQAVNASADWGALALDEDYTGVLRVEKGRVNATGGNTALAGAAKVEILAGAQFLAFNSTEPYTTPIEIAGTGWGENGYPGGLRLAGNATATWAGSVTLTADSGIMAQRGTNFTISGAITGAHQCEFYSGDPVAENGNLIVAPTVPGQNTYASTKINGRPGGSVTAGSDQAFSTGPLVVDNAILKLNGHDLGFANLSGAGGAIGNYHATTPATLTVGSDNASTSYAGVLRDGAAAPLALVKAGTGTLTLTAAQAYTGTTTVAQGKLALATPSLADTGAVMINSGAVLELNTAASDTVGSLVINGTTVPIGTYNSSHPTYGAYFSGTGSLVVGGAYDSWATSKGLTGDDALPEADPDKDGIVNLTEFYLDGNPLASDLAILPAGNVDANYLTLTFNRRDDAEASMASQMVQYGTTLGSWVDATITAATSTNPNGVIVTVVENDAASDAITVQIPRTLAVGGKLFGRLQVTK
jgi:fibronectin-binding autotransporter adhesin